MYYNDAGHVIVFLDEEYGYRQHAWYTGMTAAELEAFWASIQSMSDYYMDLTGSSTNPYKNLLGEAKCLPGTFETCCNAAQYEAWNTLFHSSEYYTAHLHTDRDSYLKAPDGREIYHKEYVPYEEE